MVRFALARQLIDQLIGIEVFMPAEDLLDQETPLIRATQPAALKVLFESICRRLRDADSIKLKSVVIVHGTFLLGPAWWAFKLWATGRCGLAARNTSFADTNEWQVIPVAYQRFLQGSLFSEGRLLNKPLTPTSSARFDCRPLFEFFQ
jgi:hypothetical protein